MKQKYTGAYNLGRQALVQKSTQKWLGRGAMCRVTNKSIPGLCVLTFEHKKRDSVVCRTELSAVT